MSGDLYLVYDVGSTYTKAAAFRLSEGEVDFLGRGQALTTLGDIRRGLGQAAEGLAPDGGAPTLLASSSAAGGLRMAAMGYMPKVTAKAAKEVAMNAGARVLEVVSHEEPPEFRLEVLREIKPDIILLAGGTDGGDDGSLLENARLIAQAGIPAKVIVAGNLSAQPEAARILAEAGVPLQRVANVMPTIHELNVRPARAAIHREFIKQITRAPGLASLAGMVEDEHVVPTPAAILMGAELLAGGTYDEDGLGALLVLDVGGATTDVHSVIPELAELKIEDRGLVVANDKQPSFRTVEGNLGLRVSASGIVEAVGPAALIALKESLAGRPEPGRARTQCRGAAGPVQPLRPGRPDGRDPEVSWKPWRPDDDECGRVVDYAAFLEANPGHLPQNAWEAEMEPALARAALETALRRHAGHWITEFNPVLGLAPGSAVGRDLRPVRWVIGVGGWFRHHSVDEGRALLAGVFKNPGLSLFPERPEFLVDRDYLLYAVGLLGRKRPDAALRFAKRYLSISEEK